MQKKVFISGILIFILALSNVFGQKGYEIDIHVNGLKNKDKEIIGKKLGPENISEFIKIYKKQREKSLAKS